MTDWIKHTTDTCPVDPDTVVEVVLRGDRSPEKRTKKAKDWWWVNNSASSVTHYRIITPAKPPEPEMTPKAIPEGVVRAMGSLARDMNDGKPDLITLRLECLKLAVAQTIQFGLSQKKGHGYLAIEELSDEYLHYVLNGSVDKA